MSYKMHPEKTTIMKTKEPYIAYNPEIHSIEWGLDASDFKVGDYILVNISSYGMPCVATYQRTDSVCMRIAKIRKPSRKTSVFVSGKGEELYIWGKDNGELIKVVSHEN